MIGVRFDDVPRSVRCQGGRSGFSPNVCSSAPVLRATSGKRTRVRFAWSDKGASLGFWLPGDRLAGDPSGSTGLDDRGPGRHWRGGVRSRRGGCARRLVVGDRRRPVGAGGGDVAVVRPRGRPRLVCAVAGLRFGCGVGGDRLQAFRCRWLVAGGLKRYRLRGWGDPGQHGLAPTATGRLGPPALSSRGCWRGRDRAEAGGGGTSGGETWSAESVSGPLAAGAPVHVLTARGVRLEVWSEVGTIPDASVFDIKEDQS